MPNKSDMLADVAARIKANPADLDALISLESGWNPEAYNSSGAIGLIQFMPQTLKDYGLLSTALMNRVPTRGVVPEDVKQAVRAEFLSKYPTIQAQLYGPVLTYFKRYMPFPTKQSLYMAVFYPAYRNVDPMTAMPDSVQKQNPGVKTVADYIAKVESRNTMKNIAKVGGVLGVAAIAALGYMYLSS